MKLDKQKEVMDPNLFPAAPLPSPLFPEEEKVTESD